MQSGRPHYFTVSAILFGFILLAAACNGQASICDLFVGGKPSEGNLSCKPL
jgi:hypothetical protein